MCFSTLTQRWFDYLEIITKEQDKGEEQCQSSGLKLKATIRYANLLAATVCSNGKFPALNV